MAKSDEFDDKLKELESTYNPIIARMYQGELVELLHHMELMMMRCLQAVVMLDLRLRKLIRVSSNVFLSNSMLEKKFQVIVR